MKAHVIIRYVVKKKRQTAKQAWKGKYFLVTQPKDEKTPCLAEGDSHSSRENIETTNKYNHEHKVLKQHEA